MKYLFSAILISASLISCNTNPLRVEFPSTIESVDDLKGVMEEYDFMGSVGLYMHIKDDVFTETTGMIPIFRDGEDAFLVAFYSPDGQTYTLIDEPVVVEGVKGLYASSYEKESVPCLAGELNVGGKTYIYVKNGEVHRVDEVE